MILSRLRLSGRQGAAALAAVATLAGMATALAPAAGATAALTATPTSTTSVAPRATTTLAGLAVSGAGNIEATLSTDLGTLLLTSNANVTLAYNNHWTGDQAVTFTGAQADVNAVLSSAKLVEGAVAGQTAHVTLSALIETPDVVYSAPNQHFYQFVSAAGISWDAAEADAAAMRFQGQPGYLATMPTAALNNFVTSKIPGALNVWFGAESIDTPGAPIQRTWQWADGPLAGHPVSYCTNFLSTCDFTNNAGLYSNWSSGEPNNYQGVAGAAYSGEWDAVTNWGSANGLWNDLAATWDQADGYVVEFGDRVTGSSDSFGGSVQTVTSAVLVAGKPDAPTAVTAARGNGKATVSWTAPANNGSAITGYTVAVSGGGSQSCASSPCDVTGLVNGTAYTFTVTATNAYGDGPASAASSAVTPATVPGAPTGVSATRGNGTATVEFTAPASDGGAAIVNYTVTADSGGRSATCATSPCVVSGLTNGTAYAFTVHATNSVGNGPDSAASAPVTPATVPAAPAAPTVTRGDQSVEVAFGAPATDGGSPVTGYVVHVWAGGSEVATQPCDDSPCTVTGLTNGTGYTATVSAVNDVAEGPASPASAAFVPATVPAAPGDLSVERGNGELVLTFDAPADNGAEITGYQVSLDHGAHWTDVDATATDGALSVTVADLANGTTYPVRVRAVNAVGAGPASSPDQDGTPATVPGAPTAVSATRGASGELVVTWTDGSDGGDAVTGYRVYVHHGTDTVGVDCAASPCTVGGLDNGTAYEVGVTAHNTVGASTESALSDPAVPATVPGAPTGLTVTSANGALVVSFTAPGADGGSAITGYEVSTDAGVHWQSLTASGSGPLTATVASLANGTTYPVEVRAVNVVGGGAATTGVDGTPATVPTAPRAVQVSRSEASATISWTAPASDGGAAITGYVVVAAPGGAQCTTSTTSCTIAALPPGITYTFSVTAINTTADRPGTGTGPAATSAPLLISGKPGVPQSLHTGGHDRTLVVSFAPPADSGGSRVTGYQVSVDGGRTWRLVPAHGRAPITVTIPGVENGATYRVNVRAINDNGVGPVTEVARYTVPTWFRDPVSRTSRKHQVPVPGHPARYRGKRAQTKAAGRSHNGTPAYPVGRLHGRQLQHGQAASLGADALFAFDSARLTPAGRAAVRALALSLRYVKAITCEGYSDFGGRTAHQKALSAQRARVVCAALRARGVHATMRIRAYGGSRPVVVGGTPANRAANRRVIVVVNH